MIHFNRIIILFCAEKKIFFKNIRHLTIKKLLFYHDSLNRFFIYAWLHKDCWLQILQRDYIKYLILPLYLYVKFEIEILCARKLD